MRQPAAMLEALNENYLYNTALYMRLSRKIVNFCRLHLTNELDKRHGVTHIGIVEVEVGCAFEVGDALAVVD